MTLYSKGGRIALVVVLVVGLGLLGVAIGALVKTILPLINTPMTTLNTPGTTAFHVAEGGEWMLWQNAAHGAWVDLSKVTLHAADEPSQALALNEYHSASMNIASGSWESLASVELAPGEYVIEIADDASQWSGPPLGMMPWTLSVGLIIVGSLAGGLGCLLIAVATTLLIIGAVQKHAKAA